MLSHITTRLLHGLLVVFGVLVIVFFLLRLGGDPVLLLLPENTPASEIERYRHLYGFDEPLPIQFSTYIQRAVRGDFGYSLRQREPALGLVVERLPATIQLTAVALGLAVVVGIPLGILVALKRGTAVELIGMVSSLLGQSIPTFWLGIMLIIVFAVRLRWLPPSGTGGWQYLVLPGIALGAYPTALTVRLLRSSLLEVLDQDYMRTARAKGLTERAVMMTHALRNSLIPVITALGLQVGFLLGGAVVTEQVFSYPGMGRLALQSIAGRDFPVVQAFVIVVAVVVVSINLLVDLVYGYLDPRIRYS